MDLRDTYEPPNGCGLIDDGEVFYWRRRWLISDENKPKGTMKETLSNERQLVIRTYL